MSKSYAVISDCHLHNWQAFSATGEDGINTRLQYLLDEVYRCAAYLFANHQGRTIVITGDVFHVRGSVAPSVFNPVRDMLRDLKKQGFEVYILAGNHDLEHKTSDTIGNAVQMLSDVATIVSAPTRFDSQGFVMVPWIESIDELKTELEGRSRTSLDPPFDLFLHAPIDGVIKGLPDHGLSADWLAALGFKRVFSGHYHHHKDFGNGVYSVGALAHHTWSDVGTKAGFLIVTDEEVKWYASHAPSFIDLTEADSKPEMELLADQNYVRAKVEEATTKSVEEMRSWLTKCGAKGVLIQSIKKPVSAREGVVSASVKGGASLEVSIAEFIAGKSFENVDALQLECQGILAEAT